MDINLPLRWLGTTLLFLALAGCSDDPAPIPSDTATDGQVTSDSEQDGHDAGAPSDAPDVTPVDGDIPASPDTLPSDTQPGLDTLGPTDSLAPDTTAPVDTEAPSDTVGSEVAQDTAIPDVPEDTAPANPCVPPCEAGTVCAENHGLCVTDCGPGFDATTMLDDLAEGWSVVQNICSSGALGYRPLSANTFLELQAQDGNPASLLFLNKVTYDGATPDVLVAVAGVSGSINNFDAFVNSYIALDPASTRALFGYVGTVPAGSPGVIYSADLQNPGGSPLKLDAPGHFSAAFTTSDSFLVSGTGAAGLNDGPGLYLVTLVEGVPTATKVVHNMGIGGGVVAVHGDMVLVSGQADPWPGECDGVPVATPKQGTKVFALALAELVQAAQTLTPIDAFCTAQALDLPPDVSFLPSGDILGQLLSADKYLTRYSWTKLANGVVFLTQAKALALGPTFVEGRGVPGSNLIVLQHQHGYLVIQ